MSALRRSDDMSYDIDDIPSDVSPALVWRRTLDMLAQAPPEVVALVEHHAKRWPRDLVGHALADTAAEPDGLTAPVEVIARRLVNHLAIWRTRAIDPQEPRPAHGPTYIDGTAKYHNVLCVVCGSRWSCRLEDPRHPIAIGPVPVVGPVVWLPGVDPAMPKAPEGQECVAHAKCWPCVVV